MQLPKSISGLLTDIFVQIEADFDDYAQKEGPLFVTSTIISEFHTLRRHLRRLSRWDNGGLRPHYRRTYYLMAVSDDAYRLAKALSQYDKFAQVRLRKELDVGPGYLSIRAGTRVDLAARAISILAEDEAAMSYSPLRHPQRTEFEDLEGPDEEEIFAGDPEPRELDISGKFMRTVFPDPHKTLLFALRDIREAIIENDEPFSNVLEDRFNTLEELIAEALAAWPDEPIREVFDAIANEATQAEHDENLFIALSQLSVPDAKQRADAVRLALSRIFAVAFDSAKLASQPHDGTLKGYAGPILERAKQIAALVPEQQVAPVRFGWREDKLSVVHVQASPEPRDADIVKSARRSIERTGEKVLEALRKSQCEHRFMALMEELHADFIGGEDIVYLGMQSHQCQIAAKAYEGEFSAYAQSLVVAYFASLHDYVSQFPEWYRFLENAAAAQIVEQNLLDDLRALLRGLHQEAVASPTVEAEVAKKLSWLAQLLATDNVPKQVVIAVAISVQNLAAAVVKWGAELAIEAANQTKKFLANAIAISVVGGIGTVLWRFIPISNLLTRSPWLETALEWLKQTLPLIKP